MRCCRVEWVRQAVRGAFVCLLITLGGCSTSLDLTTLYSQPGKYDYLRCEDIKGNLTASVAREKDLVELANKANQEVAGPAVSAAVYAADLAQVRADTKLLRQAAKDKNCPDVEPKP